MVMIMNQTCHFFQSTFSFLPKLDLKLLVLKLNFTANFNELSGLRYHDWCCDLLFAALGVNDLNGLGLHFHLRLLFFSLALLEAGCWGSVIRMGSLHHATKSSKALKWYAGAKHCTGYMVKVHVLNYMQKFVRLIYIVEFSERAGMLELSYLIYYFGTTRSLTHKYPPNYWI